MKLTDANFKRRFSVNYYRNLTLKMGEMSFFKNWVTPAGKGDPYPLTDSCGDFEERVCDSKYKVCFSGEGRVRRLMGAYFPWLTYDADIDELCGSVGFVITSPIGEAVISLGADGTVTARTPSTEKSAKAQLDLPATLSVSFRGIGVSVYVVKDGVQTLVLDTVDDYFTELCRTDVLADTKIHIETCGRGGESTVRRVEWYLHAGISQADIRPVRYEDGTPIVEGGRVFFTFSARCVEFKYQGIFSWCPTACDFKLEGALFFDMGDGYLCGDVASSLIYDRNAKTWRIAMCSFNRGHIIGMGTSISDPRFGINIIDIELMKAASEGEDKRQFLGFEGDEDPDMIYLDGKWYFAVCRCESDGYHYYHFTSPDLKEFTYLARSEGYEKTGGSYVRADDGIYFVCGSDFNLRAVYDVYSLDNLVTPVKNLVPDYDDGGFRGWGSVMMLPCGSRYRYYWITFDRHLGSHFRWSYGNIYVFESESFRK